MSNFPTSFDDDSSLPAINDNISEIGGAAINSLRDFAFNTEMYLGLGANGSQPSLAVRLGVSINPDGTINPSALTSLGLVTLPITQDQIANNAGIPESKLMLNHRTNDLFNYIRDLAGDVNTALGWIATTGIELQPHLLGAIYRHSMDQIDVSHDPVNLPFMDNKFRALRNNTNSYTLVNDINNELLAHQWADGSPFGTIQNVVTNDGSTYPSNYAHTASGIFLQSSVFSVVPQTVQDLQTFAEYVDSSSLFLIGTRIQNFYSNGVSRTSRSSILSSDGYGQLIVPFTPAIAYLLNTDTATSPVDDINHGDDIIKFQPTNNTNNSFDEQFALVRVGDIIRINYGTVEVQFVILEKRYQQDSFGNKTFLIRIAGKNLAYAPNATASINRPLFNKNKYGVLAMAAANNPFNQISSVIIASPQGAQALGIGFDPSLFDSTHYLLYLALVPTGNLTDGYTALPPIDVTGNQGATPGVYDLDFIVNTTNTAFRQAGYNYRFIAYGYQGEFGIMLADPYGNAAFTVISGVLNGAGTGYDPTVTNLEFPNNVVGVFTNSNGIIPDPLGFGAGGAGIATPPYLGSYPSAMNAVNPPTQLFVPLRQNTYYVNGVETDTLNLQVDQVIDTLGDGYWPATIDGYVVNPGPNGSVQTTYRVGFDLSTSGLAIGKTIVVQSLGAGTLVDFGRFIISNVVFNVCGDDSETFITVYDSVHAAGFSPTTTLAQTADGYGSSVALYFNSDSATFNAESATDLQFVGPFKRFFEVYVDQNRNTYSHERARINISGGTLFPDKSTPLFTGLETAKLNIVEVSPKLKGYIFSQTVTKITLNLLAYNSVTGLYDGYLCNTQDGIVFTNAGPLTIGKRGLVTRFYDETNIDYIDIVFNTTTTVNTVTNQIIDFQLFPTLSLDEEIMMLATCQLNDITKQITNITDQRQFGNISQEQLSDSAIDFIAAPTREAQENGIIRGFNIAGDGYATISFGGGSAFINGNIVQVDPQTIEIPALLEAVNSSTINTVNVITWFVCVNGDNEIELIASTDYNPTGSFAVAYSGLDQTRIFYAMNPNAVTPSAYQIRGTFLNDLILNQSDVTPIAVAVATVTNTGTFTVSTLTVKDARRFVGGGYGGMTYPFTLGVEASFRSWDSITTWLDQLNNYVSATTINSNAISNKVIVKGQFPVTQTVNLGYSFGAVYFECDTGTIDVYCPTGFNLTSNIHFDKSVFNYLYDPFISGDVGYTNANLVNSGKGLFYMSVGPNYCRNTSITNCNFSWVPDATSTINNRYSFINIEMNNPSLGLPVVLENLDISDNKFLDGTSTLFTLANFNTQRAAIAIVATGVTQNLTSIGTSLVNATIRDNVCDKDQLIGIMPTSVPSGLGYNTVVTAITTTNCFIEDNLCGAISAFGQYDEPFAIDDSANLFNFTIDKNTGLTVRGNTCKYITATDSTGTDLTYNTQLMRVNAVALSVLENTCSWIKLLPYLTSGVAPSAPNYPASTTVKNNTLYGYDFNWRKAYQNGNTDLTIAGTLTYTPAGISVFGTGTVFSAQLQCGDLIRFGTDTVYYKIAIITTDATLNLTATYTGSAAPGSTISVQKLTNTAVELATIPGTIANPTIANITNIDGNVIGIGGYSPPTAFTYDIGIFNAHSGQIVNNTISPFLFPMLNPTIAPTGIKLRGNNCTIHHNKFYREGEPWTAYIDGGANLFITGTSPFSYVPIQHLITNNYFDLTTGDNVSTETQVINISSPSGGVFGGSSSYYGNTNQVVNVAMALADDKVAVQVVDGVTVISSWVQITQGSGPPPTATAVGGTGPSSSSYVADGATGLAAKATQLYVDIPNSFWIARMTQLAPTTSGAVSASTSGYLLVAEEGTNNAAESTNIITPAPRNVSFTIPLNTRLPPGVRVTGVQMGVWFQGAGLTAGTLLNKTTPQNNAITLSLVTLNDNLTSNGAAQGILDVKSNLTLDYIGSLDSSSQFATDHSFLSQSTYTLLVGTVGSSGSGFAVVTEATIVGATQYLNVPINSNVPVLVTQNSRLSVQVDINYLRNITSSFGSFRWYFSPVLVTYQW